MKELLEKRDGMLNDAKTLIELCKTEERSFTEDEKTKYETLIGEVEKMNEMIKAESRAIEMENSLAQAPAQDVSVNNDEMRDFRDFLKAEKRDLAYSEGVFAPKQYVAEVIKELDSAVFVRQLAKKYTLTQQEAITIPKRTARVGASTWGEANVTEDTALAYDVVTIKPEVLNTLVKVSKKLLKISALPIESEVRSELVYSMASTLEQAYLTGVGTGGSPKGIFSNAVPTSRDIDTGIAPGTFITAKNKMEYKNPVWILHPDIVTEIEKLKSGDQYLFINSFRQGEPDTILGIPVIRSKFAPSATTAEAYFGALVDFSEAYAIVDVESIETQVLSELYAATNQIGYKSWFLTGGDVINPSAILRLQMPA